MCNKGAREERLLRDRGPLLVNKPEGLTSASEHLLSLVIHQMLVCLTLIQDGVDNKTVRGTRDTIAGNRAASPQAATAASGQTVGVCSQVVGMSSTHLVGHASEVTRLVKVEHGGLDTVVKIPSLDDLVPVASL